MKIRSKLAWTYIILLIIGIITISSYSILTIRSFLLRQGVEELERDTKSLAESISGIPDDDEFRDKVYQLSRITGYELALFDSAGQVLMAFPNKLSEDGILNIPKKYLSKMQQEPQIPIVENIPSSPKLISYLVLQNTSRPSGFLRLSQNKDTFFAAIASIRHIIYAGMFFSIGAVIIVSFLFARYMAAPIQFLNEAALSIAEGNVNKEIRLVRDDEFGTLASSLNKMASRLKSDNEQLKKMNQKQQQFFADMTHEIRNPLHTISGALEMLEMENLDKEKKQKYILTARKQAMRMARLFEDIKTLQRYDLDDTFIQKQWINIHEIAAEVAEMYQPLAEEKEMSIKTHFAGEGTVFADPSKIEQVFDNLISNAIKYSNGGELLVSCVQEKQKVKVSVQDFGIGISAEHLDRLFDRFYRTDKARSRDKGGTGLGLSVVKSILNAHQSDIFVSSSPGEGSTFHFYLDLGKP